MALKLATVVNVDAGETCDVLCDRSSKWGNPFSHRPNTRAQFQVKTRKEACTQYRIWFWKQDELVKSLHELRGKRCGCHCKPLECHVDFLVDITNRLMLELFI